jgi:hypothetical protein
MERKRFGGTSQKAHAGFVVSLRTAYGNNR